MKNFYEIDELPDHNWQPQLNKPMTRRPYIRVHPEPEPLPTRRLPVPEEKLSSPFRFDYSRIVNRSL